MTNLQSGSVCVQQHTSFAMMLLGSWTADVLAAMILLSITFYYWWTSPFKYWKKLNIPYIEPKFPFGNMGSAVTGKVSFAKICDNFYAQFKSHGFGGVYNVRLPTLFVCDPEIVKHMLTKDFNSFHDRGMPHDEENDPLSANLFALEGERWRNLRAKLSPTFTSGKIKAMFPLIYDCTQNFKDCLQTAIQKNNSVEMKDLLYRFTTDVIGTCAFGIDCNSLKDPTSKFHHMGREVVRSSVKNNLRFLILFTFPKAAKYLTSELVFPKTSRFFKQLVDSTVKYRKENNVDRNDFVQLMMKLVEEDSQSFSQDIMTGQALLFFLAGLDNVANNIGFCLHAVAVDQELQERVHSEVEKVLEDFNGKNCYEAIGQMNLLQRVIDEGLRMYTSVTALMRKQTSDSYVIPGTNTVIPKDTNILISAQAIHRDEAYYPNPDKFDPDRFTEEEKLKRHPFAYLPFGDGPRFCIASRFALLEMRLCFAELIRHFHFSVAPETDLSLETDPASFGPTPKRGFWLRVSEREV